MTVTPPANPPRLLIIGAGSSGLVTLKYALDELPDWRIDCFEATDRVTGAWGNPYTGFVSTSTKYTTQFSCFPCFDASVAPDGGAARTEFFRDGEYGEYLTRFAERFDLRRRVLHGYKVQSLSRAPSGRGWEVTHTAPGAQSPQTRRYDAVVVCTGLVAEPRPLGDDPRVASLAQVACPDPKGAIAGKTVLVVGGGEMGADLANRLADPSLGNRVFLSLRSGIRVSPRYHPIRGVPSDFLRNRLLLSIHEDIRNWIGERFVALRIRHEGLFERLFPHAAKRRAQRARGEVQQRKRRWSEALRRRAGRGLFDMFHNKSDDFLDAIAHQRLEVVGPPTDAAWTSFAPFDGQGEGVRLVNPDVIVPAIGFRSALSALTGGQITAEDFYLGCRHVEHDGLYLVGFARPVIGNIPSISEVQARYVAMCLAGRIDRPADLARRHAEQAAARRRRFSGVDHKLIYPVEMFPYCDRLARAMGVPPRTTGPRAWWEMLTAPATTLDYPCWREERASLPRPRRYLPLALVLLLLSLKPVDAAYRVARRYR